MKHRSLWVLAAVGLLAFVSAVGAHAATNAITACVDNRTGLLSIVPNQFITTTNCPTGLSPLSWNAQGPVGPAGPAGPQGPAGSPPPYQVVVSNVGIDPGQVYAWDVRCSNSQFTPVSGQWGIGTLPAGMTSYDQIQQGVQVIESKQDGAQSWLFRMKNLEQGRMVVQGIVLCMQLGAITG